MRVVHLLSYHIYVLRYHLHSSTCVVSTPMSSTRVQSTHTSCTYVLSTRTLSTRVSSTALLLRLRDVWSTPVISAQVLSHPALSGHVSYVFSSSLHHIIYLS